MKAVNIIRNCEGAVDTITLDSIERHRRRIMMTSDNGAEFLLDLERARLLNHGDGLQLEDGRVIEVRAAPENLYKVKGASAKHLLQLAWQLGNRHLPAQICDYYILIRKDPVIAEMVLGLGGEVEDVVAPFSPEGGAYHHHHKE